MKSKIIILFVLLTQFCSAQESFLSFEKAKELAQLEEKQILMVFSGSDWCKPCIQFKQDILESEDFQKAKNDQVLLYLDFPYKRKNALSKEEETHNEGLAETYNPEGKFPKIILLDAEGLVWGEIEYSQNLNFQNFQEQLQSIKSIQQ